MMRMLKSKNQQPTTPTQPLPPPPIITGPQNPFRQNPSAPGGGVIIGSGNGLGVNKYTTYSRDVGDPIANTINYLFPIIGDDARHAYLDTLDRAVRGDFASKADIKQAFLSDYKFLVQSDWNQYYKNDPESWKPAFQERYSTWLDKATNYFIRN